MPRLWIEGTNGEAALGALDLPRTTLGRAPNNDIVLDDPSASRYHAVIEKEAAFFIIKDLASTNGLHVNGRRVHAKALFSGDRISIGGCRARFVADEDFADIVVELLPSLPGLRADLVGSGEERMVAT